MRVCLCVCVRARVCERVRAHPRGGKRRVGGERGEAERCALGTEVKFSAPAKAQRGSHANERAAPLARAATLAGRRRSSGGFGGGWNRGARERRRRCSSSSSSGSGGPALRALKTGGPGEEGWAEWRSRAHVAVYRRLPASAGAMCGRAAGGVHLHDERGAGSLCMRGVWWKRCSANDGDGEECRRLQRKLPSFTPFLKATWPQS